MKDIVRFIKKDVTLYDVIEFWSEDRGAAEACSIFDLRLRRDFVLFKHNYGLVQTLRYRKQSQFWLDGISLEKPQSIDFDGMERFINDEVACYIEERLENGDYIGQWADIFDMDGLLKVLEG